MIAHEPPAHSLLPEFEIMSAGPNPIYQAYREGGIIPALELFASMTQLNEHEAAGLQASMDPRNGPYSFANAMYWFEREVNTYPATAFDLTVLEQVKVKLVLANGVETPKEAGHYRPNMILAEKLRVDVKMLPGAHLGAISHADDFANGVVDILKERL